MDLDYPDVNESRFQKIDWEDFYKGAEVAIPNNVPEARGRAIGLHYFVDADHASEKVTRRSQTGIIIFGNNASLVMFSKHQHLVQRSTFGSEFLALRQVVELVQALRLKLRQFGIPGRIFIVTMK